MDSRRTADIDSDDDELRRSVSAVRFGPALGVRQESPLANAEYERGRPRDWSLDDMERVREQVEIIRNDSA
eukprot:10082512-Prorocentrum_lima.AAC.1